jgi:hypothetical protein
MSQMIEDLLKRLEASKYTRLHKYVTLLNGGKYCNAAAAPKTKFLGPQQRNATGRVYLLHPFQTSLVDRYLVRFSVP